MAVPVINARGAEAPATDVAVPVKLAIMAGDPALAALVDLITAEFTRTSTVQVLEREAIQKVWNEQGLSAANNDGLKLGRVLGADGLLLLEVVRDSAGPGLQARLVATSPGVIVGSARLPWPLRAREGVSWLRGRFDPLLPKLKVQSKDAVPFSILALRSAVSSPGAREFERQMTILATERLAQERELFVLERQRMELLGLENELSAVEDASFWTGSYLLEGVLDKDGYSQETITLSAQLVPPHGAPPVVMEISGPRTNPVEVVNRLADKILKGLRLRASAVPWNMTDEAERYFQQAQWAFKWGIPREAQKASEASWALGKRSRDLDLLRIRSYLAEQWTPRSLDSPPLSEQSWNLASIGAGPYPDASSLRTAIRAMEIFCEPHGLAPLTATTPDLEWCDLGLELLERSSALLQAFFKFAELRQGNEDQLAQLRSLVRSLSALLTPVCPPNRGLGRCTAMVHTLIDGCLTLNRLKWEASGLWFERPEDALPSLRGALEADFHPFCLPMLIGWSWEDRKRIPAVLSEFIEELCHSTNDHIRLEGLYLSIMRTPADGSGRLEASENELGIALCGWARKEPEECAFLGSRTELALRQKFDVSQTDMLFEPFASFQRTLSGQLSNALQQQATLVLNAPVPEPPMLSAAQAQEVIRAGAEVLKFAEWKINLPGYEPSQEVEIQSGILRYGRAWFQAHYQRPNAFPGDRRIAFAAVDVQTGAVETIPFPANLGSPDGGRYARFEVTPDALVVSVQDHLERYDFSGKTWERISVPMEHGARISFVKGNCYLTTRNSILKVAPPSNTVQILASTRRDPPVHDLDTLGRFGVVSTGAAGEVSVTAGGRTFCWLEGPRTWKEVDSSGTTALPRVAPNGVWVEFQSGGLGRLVATGPKLGERVRLPLLFERDGLPIDPMHPPRGQFRPGAAGEPFCLQTNQCLLIVSRSLGGHWLLRVDRLETRLHALRKSRDPNVHTPGLQEADFPAATEP